MATNAKATKGSQPNNLSRFQKFEVGTVQRADIKRAAYNPRVMDADAAKMLKRGIKTLGLVEPLIWNRRTGNLVGGHQRLDQLDALEKGEGYSLTLAIVDVDEHEEKKLNLALNNRNLQGDWEEESLGVLLREFEQVDFDAIGITPAEVDYLTNEDSTLAALDRDSEERAETKDILDDIKQERADMNEHLREEARGEFFCVLVFEDGDERAEFYKAFGLHLADSYIRGTDLLRGAEA